MKKTLLSLLAIFMATVAFAGDGTKENPYTVAEVMAFTPMDGSVTAYVKGYIVGTVPSGSSISSFTTDAGEKASATNLFIADSQSETDYNACIPVQLPKGEVREGLNLKDNPTNLGKTVVLAGTLNKYFGAPGVKSVTEFELSGETTYTGDSGSGGEGGDDDPGTTTQTNYVFTKATSLTNEGQYVIGATVDGKVKVAQNLAADKSYGYLQVTETTEEDGKVKLTSMDHVFTIKGSNIIDNQGRYVYQTGTYNSFNVAANATEGIDWTIAFNEDGTVTITNDDVQKSIQYDSQYNSYGSYEDVRGIYPSLYLLTGTEDVTPIDPVETPLSKISEVQAGSPGTYKIQGTVVAMSASGAVVSDGTGYIYIYDTNISSAVGDQVTVEGTTSVYGGFQQFSSSNGYTLTKTGTTTVSHPEAVELDLDAWLAAPVMQYVKLTGTLAISGKYYNVTVDGKTAVGSLVSPTDAIKEKLVEGAITVYGYAIYTSGSSTKYVNIIVTSVDGEDVPPVVPTVDEISIAEFLQKADTETTYQLTGLVGTIKSTKYGNFYLVDQNDSETSVYVYGLIDAEGNSQIWSGLGIEEGDIITIQGKYLLYNDTPEIKDAVYVKHEKGSTPAPSIENTPETAYTVTEALALIEAGKGLSANVYVKGTISEIKSLDTSKYQRAQYYITDGTSTILVYNGYYLGGADFTSDDQIKVGDEVIVYGQLTLYKETPEINANNQLYSLNGETSSVKGIDADLKAQGIFDLAGRRVDQMKKGIYIVGGKKVLK